MSDVQQNEHVDEIAAAREVTLDHAPPFRLFRLGDLCEAVSGKIHENQRPSVHAEVIHQSSASGISRSARKFAVAGEKVDEGRLADIGLARKRDLRRAEIGQFAGVGDRNDKFRIFDDHGFSFSLDGGLRGGAIAATLVIPRLF